MKSKYMFWLLLVGLLGLVLILAACDQTTEPNDGVRTIPHSLKLGSANCITCHTGGLHPVPADHTTDAYPLETCSLPRCHAESNVTEPSIPTITTHGLTGAYSDCMVCHAAYKTYEFPDTANHIIATNNVCLKCHYLPGRKWDAKTGYCGICHYRPYLESWESSHFLANNHAEADIVCLDCHGSTLELGHQRGELPDGSAPREFIDEFCVVCHGDWPVLIALTAEKLIWTEEWFFVNPHVLHLKQDEAGCYSCHKVHREEPGLEFCSDDCH